MLQLGSEVLCHFSVLVIFILFVRRLVLFLIGEYLQYEMSLCLDKL